jgi:hypothetical protein
MEQTGLIQPPIELPLTCFLQTTLLCYCGNGREASGNCAGSHMQKRRTAPRQRTLKGGTISFGHAVIDCVLRNVSATGACLEVASPIGIPDDFTLIIKSDNTSRAEDRCPFRISAMSRCGQRGLVAARALLGRYCDCPRCCFRCTVAAQLRYLKVIRSVRLRVEALFFKGSFVAFELF